MRIHGLGLASLSLFCFTAACGPQLSPPRAFGKLHGGDYDYRATTPQGVVIAARSEKNEPRADIDFWSRAVDVRLARDGYAKTSEAPVTTARGLHGIELAYAKQEEGRSYTYVVALFVKDGRVYVVEAGGDKDEFTPLAADVEKAIASLAP